MGNGSEPNEAMFVEYCGHMHTLDPRWPLEAQMSRALFTYQHVDT